VVGVSHATAALIGAAISRWWRVVGKRRYPDARRALLNMDTGGANNPRTWLWMVALQKLADETGLIIVVNHYPSGASKWNPIEHELFSEISHNWAGEPLISYETIVKYIRTTRTKAGLPCRACLDWKEYPTKQHATDEQKARVRLKPSTLLPKWNYTISPHRYPKS